MSEPSARELLEQQAGDMSLWPARDAARNLADRVEKVLALHRHVPGPTSEGKCAACSGVAYSVLWPCPTVRLLNGGDEQS